MNEDVFASWKGKRFIVAPSHLADTNERLIVLTDIAYWNEHYEELKDWCDEHLADTEGMTVSLPNDKILTLFVLKWA